MENRQEFLNNAVEKICKEIIFEMRSWAMSELDCAIKYLMSAPYKGRIRNDIAESLAELISKMPGADER